MDPTRQGPPVRRRIRWYELGLLVVAPLLIAGGLKVRLGVSPQASSAAPARMRIGVVDLDAVVRAHPRWSEFDALNRRISTLEGQLAQLAQVPAPPPPPRAEIQRALDQEAAHLKAAFEKEIEFLRQESHRQFDAFSAIVREEQEAKFAATRKELEAGGRAAIEAKQKELEAQLRSVEQEIMKEYTYPLLNLRLRAEVAGLSSEEEGRAVLRAVQALQEEREDRIKVKNAELDKELQEFQKAKEGEVNAQLDALKDALNKEVQDRVIAKQQELEAEFNRIAATKDQQFRKRLEQRQKVLLAAAETQLRTQQRAYLSGLGERARRLQADLSAVQEQRARLDASVLAEVKVSVAAIAQAEKLDVVLTRYVANISGVNITSAVVQRLKR